MDSEDPPTKLINAGAEIAGAAVGGALGFLAGGPLAAAVAAVLGSSISTTLGEFASRQLSRREEKRVGAAAAFSLAGIRARLELGMRPREDGFFASATAQRSSADELLEGVLQSSKIEYEERKIEYLGNLYANVAFSPGISAAEANHMLGLADELSFRQMCLLSVIARKHEISGLSLRATSYVDPPPTLTLDAVTLLQQAFDLHMHWILASKHGAGYRVHLGWWGLKPKFMELTPLGERLVTALGIRAIPLEDLHPVITDLSEPEASAVLD